MSAPRSKVLTPDQAERLLFEGDEIEVVRQREVDGRLFAGGVWSRSEVMDHFRKFGVEVSGQLAQEKQYALVSKNDAGFFVYFRTRTQ